jgi:hypothetical protein
MPRSLALLLVATALAPARAGATTPVLAGRVERVVAAGEGVAVLRGGQVLLVDGAGNVVGRCGGQNVPAGRARRADGTIIPSERLLREAGFREDDDSPEAEALLDDEGFEPRRRRRPTDVAAGMPRALSLAADHDAAWIGTADGLWRLDARTAACARAGLPGRAVQLVAVRAEVIEAVADVTVWRSADAGASFTVAGVLSARPRAVALAADGTAFVATDDAVVMLTAPRVVRPVLDRPADDLVPCGDGVVALGEDGVHALDGDGRAQRLGDRPPVRALACASSTGPRLVAAGVGAWSTDDGRRWQEEAAFLGRSIGAVAFAAGRTWLALEDGLVASPDFEGAPAAEADVTRRPRAPPAAGGLPSWGWLLPTVSVSFDGAVESRGRAGWRLWLVLSVSLDRRPFIHLHAPQSPEVPLQ